MISPTPKKSSHSFTEEDERALALEALATAVHGVARTSLMNFVGSLILTGLAWMAGEPGLGLVLVAISAGAAVWRSTFRRRLYNRRLRGVDPKRARLELSLNAALSGSMWCAASLWVLPALPSEISWAYLAMLSVALCTAVVHLSSLRGVAETYVAVQLICLTPLLARPAIPPYGEALGLAILVFTYFGLVGTGQHLAKGIIVTARRMSRSYAARRLIARRRNALPRRRQERTLLANAEARALCVAKITHDLRSPLQTITSATELLELRCSKHDYAKEVLDPARRMSNASDRLIELANELTDFLRWSAGTMPIRNAEVDLYALAQRLIDEMLPRAEANKIAIRLEGDSLMAVTDPVRLRAIGQNLLSNAIKYGRDEVVLSAHRSPDGAPTLLVADKGPGLPENVLSHLGKPWNVGDPTVPRGGFGLGLYIVHSLSAELGLQLAVSSSERGTAFHLVFSQESGNEVPDPDV